MKRASITVFAAPERDRIELAAPGGPALIIHSDPPRIELAPGVSCDEAVPRIVEAVNALLAAPPPEFLR